MNSQLCIVLLSMAACVCAAPKPSLFAGPVVTATSSQVIARNYNGLVAPYAPAPYVSSPYVVSPYAGYAPYAPYSAYSPYAAAYQPPVIL